MSKQTIQIADKPTEDEILALLKSSEIGLAVLKEMLAHGADADTVAAIKALLENGTYGLNAIKTAINGRANETTSAAIKALLENGTYGLNALKTAIDNASKYNNVSTGQLVFSKTLTHGTQAANVKLTEYSAPLSVSGNGEILLFGWNSSTAATNYMIGTHTIYLNGITVDGVALPDKYVLKSGTEISNTGHSVIEQYRFKFAKSFSCKFQIDFRWSTTAPSTGTIKFYEKIDYLLQTR